MSGYYGKFYDETIPETDNAMTYERAVLGQMIRNGQTVSQGLSLLSDEYFKYEQHLALFRAIRVIWGEEKDISPVKLLEYMGRSAEEKRYITDISAVPYCTVESFKDDCRLVADAYRARCAEDIIYNSGINQSGTGNETEKIKSVIERLSMLVADRDKSDFKHIKDIVSDYWDDIANGTTQKGRIDTGFAKLDAILGGIYPKDMVTIAAATSVGKTAFVLNIAKNIAKTGKKVLIYTLEMSGKQNIHRMLANLSNVRMRAVKNPEEMDKKELESVFEASGRAGKMNICIKDSGGLRVSDIKLDLASHTDADVVIIDHIGLLNAEKRSGNRTFEMSQIAIDLKSLAAWINKPVIALCQFSRDGSGEEKSDATNMYRKNKTPFSPPEPRLRWLRDSGEIEQSSSAVVMLWRLKGYEWNNKIGVKVAKNRQDTTGKFALKFKAEVMQYEDVEHDFNANEYENDSENVI